MNIISIASIKRSGMNAVFEAMPQGKPAYLMKHNRAGHVILTREHYEQLVKAEDELKTVVTARTQTQSGTIQWMLEQPINENGLNKEQMKARLAELHSGWNER